MINQTDFIDAVVWSLPFIALCIGCYKLNFTRPYRYKQFFLPIVAAIFCIVFIIELDPYTQKILAFVQENKKLFDFIASDDADLLNSRIIFVVNCAAAAAFLIIKTALLPLLWTWMKNAEAVESTAGMFYELRWGKCPKRKSLYDDEPPKDGENSLDGVDFGDEDSNDGKDDAKPDAGMRNWRVLKPKYRGFRLLFGGFYIACFAASVLVFWIGLANPRWRVFSASCYPVFAILMLGEIKAFLSGLDHIDEVKKAPPAKPKKEQNPNFLALLNEIRAMYPDRAAYDEVTQASDDDLPISVNQIDDFIRPDGDQNDRIVAEHFKHLCAQGHKLDLSAIQTTLALMQGQSAVFMNPFYRDLADYILLPMARQLYRYKKCLIIVGRNDAAEDVKDWCARGIADFFGTQELWKTEFLVSVPPTADIGILKFNDICRRDIQIANAGFFKQVGFVLIIEPSKFLSTGQIALNLLVSLCENETDAAGNSPIVYAVCDRNCDGLVDAMSHALHAKITDVSATLNNCADNYFFYWTAEGDSLHHRLIPDIARYLGAGTTIGALALKHQIRPAVWIGGDKFPVSDIKWIDGQYYRQLCRAANLPADQAAWNEAFQTEPNLWQQTSFPSVNFAIEDEFCNIFEITRLFSTRYSKEGAIHVISEHYMLRDYMYDNIAALIRDPKAIPTIVPDFARTERNLVLKLIMRMSVAPVSEADILHEFQIYGLSSEENASQDPVERMRQLFEKHCDVSGGIRQIWTEEKTDNPLIAKPVRRCAIQEDGALSEFARKLRPATIIAEDELGQKHFISSLLCGHVYQVMLPGQFITSEGKYYQVQTIAPDNSVVARRAADHIDGRRYFRQLKRAVIRARRSDSAAASARRMIIRRDGQTFSAETARGYANIEIATDGYLQTDELSNIAGAKKYLLNGIPTRYYKNKSVLRLRLPQTTPQIRRAIALLLNEIFRTAYPEGHPYIFATLQFDASDFGMLADLCPPLELSAGETDDFIAEQDIVFIEDSDLDLGLLTSVERNLDRFFAWMADFLDWHAEIIAAPADAAIERLENAVEKTKKRIDLAIFAETAEETPKKLGLIERILRWLKRRANADSMQPEPAAPACAGSAADDPATDEKETLKTQEEHLRTLKRMSRCQHNDFLLFGCGEVPEALQIDSVRAYLASFGFGKSPLKSVRQANCKHADALRAANNAAAPAAPDAIVSPSPQSSDADGQNAC